MDAIRVPSTLCAAGLLLLLLLLRSLAADVVINEIHYEPEDNTLREEFIELYNSGKAAADLSGWFFSSGVSYVFPEGTEIGPEEFLVVAQDPEALSAAFPTAPLALGPYAGRLSNEGERVVLRNAVGARIDEVDYAVRFPWPLASSGRGSSMELQSPSLDNNLGSSWRPSGFLQVPFTDRVFLVDERESDWRFRKGTSEASDPTDAWRQLDFVEDASWTQAQTPIGYPESEVTTYLDDMRASYTSIFLRRKFSVEGKEFPSTLKLSIAVDDGAIVWINGVEVLRVRVPDGDIPFDGRSRGSTEARWEDFLLPSPSEYLRNGENQLAIHALNSTPTSIDFSIDARVFIPGAEDFQGVDLVAPPTPGARNSVFTENAAPLVRQVAHLPEQPTSADEVRVTAKITDPDGIGRVELSYQVVLPGEYIPAFLPLPHGTLLTRPRDPRPPNPAFEDAANWTRVGMSDTGRGGDEHAGDGIYTAILPAQANRTLLRYRIVVRDALGVEATAPYRDDRSLNFAAFVYDGLPDYTAQVSVRGAGTVYSAEDLASVPVYFLITRNRDVVETIAASGALQIPQGNQARFAENWEGAFVYDGIVYDHITYRLRGANGRYQVPQGNPSSVAGKRHWRFKFNKGNYLRARDKWGNRYPTRWRVLNTGRMFGNRLDGNWGLGDQVNDYLWRAIGVAAAFGHAFHFRVVDGAEETPDQYNGDFWGLARAFENYDSRFLEAHSLPKGNLYKLVNQTRNPKEQQRYQAPEAVTNGGDHNNIEGQLRSSRSTAWLEAHVNYDMWYRYHSIAQALRHYDYWPDANKNAAWYFEPIYTPENNFFGRMWTLPFDADATWGPTWNNGIDRPYDAIFTGGGKPEMQKAYRAQIRSVRDLLWQRDQLTQIIKQVAAFMDPLEEADIDRWRNAPPAAGRQWFPQPREGTLAGKVQDMLNFAFVGGNWDGGGVGAGGRATFLDSFADGRDRSTLPSKPSLTYMGPDHFPADQLMFLTSAFEDPRGGETFGAMEWRLAKVSHIPDAETAPLSAPIWKVAPVNLELQTTWTSGLLSTFDAAMKIPVTAVVSGHRYRVRVRMQDDTAVWSHWSDPIDFTVAPTESLTAVQTGLRVTELMFHPLGDDDDFEFIELQNVGTQTLDLRQVRFTEGIRFDFADSAVTELGPRQYVVLVNNLDVFARRYDLGTVRVGGEYDGNLSNNGELLELVEGRGLSVLRFEYDDEWVASADGMGHSLVIIDPGAHPVTWDDQESWRASHRAGGSPGRADTATGGGLQRPGDIQQDGRLNVSDAIGILSHLFRGSPANLPCGDGSPSATGNRLLLDVNGDESVTSGDAIHLLAYLFRRGPMPALTADCVPIPGCPESCLP